MPFNIEMTGAEDYQRTVKAAICGYPGAGKTLFASTAPQVFFVFFRDQPRIMSIADRYMPHTKLVNKYDESGRLETPIWETLAEVIEYLRSGKGDYKSVCIDTGDELFQAMKEGRKAANRGKFAIQDWGWIGDMYREIINGVIDLPMNVIINYHLKTTQEGEDGEVIREIALQGQAKDEVAGWFDIVGVIDSWEEDTDDGKVVHRGILTDTTPKYPFVKDHSGKLPRVFELSENFVGDFARMSDLIYADIPASGHETLEVVEVEKAEPKPKAKTSAETGVPTPEEVAKKKGAPKSEAEDTTEAGVADGEDEDPDGKGGTTEGEDTQTEGKSEEGEASPDSETETSEQVDEADSEEESATEESGTASGGEDEDSPAGDGPTADEATATLEKELGATVVEATCEVEEDGEKCGNPLIKGKTDQMGEPVVDKETGEIIMVPDRDLMDLTKIRFRKYMCREHFKEARKG